MFANKFLPERDSLVTLCLGEWIANKTLDFYTGNDYIDTTVYETSSIVAKQNTESIDRGQETTFLEFNHIPNQANCRRMCLFYCKKESNPRCGMTELEKKEYDAEVQRNRSHYKI